MGALREGKAISKPVVGDRVARVARSPALLAALVAATFIGISIWWLTVDREIPIFDPGMHLEFAFGDYGYLHSGQLLKPFEIWTQYPPLVHLVGAISVFIGGVPSVAGPVAALNLVFVPLLAVACYRTGRLTFGGPAGVLAVLFALGTPMLAALFHQFFTDTPEAAMAAVGVWLLLEGRGFERPWVSAAAGIACGLGLLTKQSFPVFVGGVFLVVLFAGGWRHWRGLLAFLVLAAAIALPWYLYHLKDTEGLAKVAAASRSPDNSPPLLSPSNLAWYLWSGLNLQAYAPLMAFAGIGTVWTVVQLIRGRLRDTPALALIVGALVSYIGITAERPHDPRYSLPALIYLAVLGTGWITAVRWRPARLGLGGLLLAAVVANTLGASFGVGSPVIWTLPGAPAVSEVWADRVTLYSSGGYLVSGPRYSGNLVSLLRAERQLGFTTMTWDPAQATASFSDQGLGAVAEISGLLSGPGTETAIAPRTLFLLHEAIAPGSVPCARLWDGTGVWMLARETPTKPPILVCPTHRTRLPAG